MCVGVWVLVCVCASVCGGHHPFMPFSPSSSYTSSLPLKSHAFPPHPPHRPNYITGGTLTRAQRPALSPSAGGPGPGSYSPLAPSDLAAGGSSSGGPASFPRDPRFHGSRDEGAPGPGSHNTAGGFSYLLPQSPRSVMGRAARDAGGGSGGATADVPLYTTSVAATRPTSPRQPIGSAPRFSPGHGEDTPGPGAFLGTVDISRGPAWTLRAR